MLRGSQPVISSTQAASGAYESVVRSRNVLCDLETDGFCVCDTAQSFLGLGNGTQVLYSTSNKRSALCDPDNAFHTDAFSGRFSFLGLAHLPAQGKHHLSFSSPCVCQISNTSTTHLLPNASKVGLDEFLFDVFEVTAPLRCTLCTTLLSLGDAVLQASSTASTLH